MMNKTASHFASLMSTSKDVKILGGIGTIMLSATHRDL